MKCSKCGHDIPAGKAQCPSCKTWHSPSGNTGSTQGLTFKSLAEVKTQEVPRIVSGPWDKCFGGGITRTSVTLLAGSPGAGKSTLSLQIADSLTLQVPTLYVSGEQTGDELKQTAMRIGVKHMALMKLHSTLDDGSMTVETIVNSFQGAMILDSLRGLIKEDNQRGVELAKLCKRKASKNLAPVLMLQHITKADSFAGSMDIQHEVDCLMTFYPDENGTRILHVGSKNRYGPSGVSVTFDMTETGLRLGVGLPAGKGVCGRCAQTAELVEDPYTTQGVRCVPCRALDDTDRGTR
jgi:DNA repair protein RadA/Sms